MFKKPFRIRTSNRLKGSERKKLKQNILKQFPQMTDEKLGEILPNKEDVFVTKVETHNDICVTCYCLNKNPLFFEVEKENMLYPTVYTLWQFADLIPYMVTSPPVFEKINRGADLMLPGVIVPYGGFEGVVKGQVMAIRIMGNSAPVAVGVAALSSEEMVECGMRGKGIIIHHWYTDNLWALGDSSEMPVIPESFLNCLNDGDSDEEAQDDSPSIDPVKSALQDFNITNEESTGMQADSRMTDENTMKAYNDSTEQDVKSKAGMQDKVADAEEGTEMDIANGGAADETEETVQLTVEEQMDLLLWNCFCQALIDAKKAEFPMLVTSFSAKFLHPACPDGRKIDIKKTKYKKMSKFLQEMETQQLVKVAELSKGVLSIMEINLQNEILRDFKSSTFAKEKSAAKAEAKIRIEEQNLQEGLHIVEMFAVSGKTQAFFRLFEKSKGDAFTAAGVRDFIKTYVRDNELASQKDKRKVVLDPILSDVIFDKNFREDVVTWDVLISRLLEKMNPCHKIVINGKESKIKKGKAEPIEVTVAQRMGNKKVTLIQNLEQFGIDPNEFAHQIQLAAASSTSVSSVRGKNTVQEQVLVQGNQISHVAKVLDELKIPKKYIIGLDKYKSKGKKR